MTQASVVDDLTYIRDLAEAGQSAPLLGGRFLAWWGLIATLAYAGHYAIISGKISAPDTALIWLWGSFSIVGPAGYFLLVRTLSGKPGTASVGNRVEATVWMAGGFALFAYFGGLITLSVFDQSASSGFEYSLPVVFAVYGIGLLTSGFMGREKVLTYAGFAALAFITISVWFSGSAEAWAVAAAGVLLTVLVPGLVLLRREPASIV